jgi:hypothetical protein
MSDIDKMPAGRELYVFVDSLKCFYHWVPCYSTDIAAAWEVVEKMAEITYAAHVLCKIEYKQHVIGSNSWEVKMSTKIGVTPPRNDERAEAETAPLAICRAALKAVANDD